MNETTIQSGPLHINLAGFNPKAVALAALWEEFPEGDTKYSFDELFQEVAESAKNITARRDPDPFDPEGVPRECDPEWAWVYGVKELFGHYSDIWPTLRIHRDARDGKIFAWQIKRG